MSVRNRNKKELTLARPPPSAGRAQRSFTPPGLSPLFSPPDEDSFEPPFSSSIQIPFSLPTGRLSLLTSSLSHLSPPSTSNRRSLLSSSLGSPFRLDSADSFGQQQHLSSSINGFQQPPPLLSLSSFDVEMDTPPTPRNRDGSDQQASTSGGEADWKNRQNISGVGFMGARRVGGSWAMNRAEGAGPQLDEAHRETAERGARYADLSASAGPSSPSSSSFPSSFQGHQQGYLPASSSSFARPFAPQRSFSSAVEWTPQFSTSSSSHPLGHHSVPSHAHSRVGSSSFASQTIGGTVTSSADYYSPPPQDPYASPSRDDSPSSYPVAYSLLQTRHLHISPPPSHPVSAASRPTMAPRSKTTDALRTAQGSVSSSSGYPSSTLVKKKKSSVGLASSYTRAAPFPPSPQLRQSSALLTSSSMIATAFSSASSSVPVSVPDSRPKKSHGPIRSPGHTPRPPNSWILYRSDTIKKIKDAKARGEEFPVPAGIWDDPTLLPAADGSFDLPQQGDVSKMISLLWKKESKEVRLRYDKLSAVRKAEHARLYPNYKYQPQRKNAPPVDSVQPGSSSNTLSRKKKGALSLPPSNHFVPPVPESNPTFPSSSSIRRQPSSTKKSSIPKERRNSPYARSSVDKSPEDEEPGLQPWGIPRPANGALEAIESELDRYAMVQVQRQTGDELAFRESGGEEGAEGQDGRFGGERRGRDEYRGAGENDDHREAPPFADPQQILSNSYSNRNRAFDEPCVPPASGFHSSQLASLSSYDHAESQETSDPNFANYSFQPSSDYVTYQEYAADAHNYGESYTTSSSFSSHFQAPLFTPPDDSVSPLDPNEPQDPNHYAAIWCLLEDDPPLGEGGGLPSSLAASSSWADGTWDVIGEEGLAVLMNYSFEDQAYDEQGSAGLGLRLGGEESTGGGGGLMTMMGGTEGAADMVILEEEGEPGTMTVAELVRAQWEQDRARYQATERGEEEGNEGFGQQQFEGEQGYHKAEERYEKDVSRHDSAVQWSSEADCPSHSNFIAPSSITHPSYRNARSPSSSDPTPNSPPHRSIKPEKSRQAPAPIPVAPQETYPDHHLPALAPSLPLAALPSDPKSYHYVASSPQHQPQSSSSSFIVPTTSASTRSEIFSPPFVPLRSTSGSFRANSPSRPATSESLDALHHHEDVEDQGAKRGPAAVVIVERIEALHVAGSRPQEKEELSQQQQQQQQPRRTRRVVGGSFRCGA